MTEIVNHEGKVANDDEVFYFTLCQFALYLFTKGICLFYYFLQICLYFRMVSELLYVFFLILAYDLQ